MPRKPNPDLKRVTINGNEYYKSRYKTSQEYDKNNYDQIKLRVCKGSKKILMEYLEQKKSENSDNPKYKSLNSMIISLLEEEVGKPLN